MSNLRGMPDSKKRLFIRSVEVCVSSGEGGVGKEGRLGGGRRSRGKRDGVTSEGGHALLKVSGAYMFQYISSQLSVFNVALHSLDTQALCHKTSSVTSPFKWCINKSVNVSA